MKIYLYFDDHDPPHIHIRGQHKAEIYIQTGSYKNGILPLNKQRNILVWLNEYQDDIMGAWNDCWKFQNPGTIPPL